MGKACLEDALKAARETRVLEIDHAVLGHTPQIFRQSFGDKPALIVADKNTFRAAGEILLEAFRSAGHPCREPFVYTDPNLYAEHKFVVALEQGLRGNQAIPIAVGSGVINDLVKLAAHRAGRAYLAVPTAASMDGYTAFGASITYHGSKQTFSCPAPLAVVADLEVIGAAPREMNAAGYADLLAKTTAGADWLLADALGAEPLHHEAWNIVQGGLRDALANPAGVRISEPESIRRLTQGLLLSGFAMQSAQSSRPASGAEHQFSHLWDMQRHTHNGAAPSHGFKVGIGTLAIAALYEYILAQPWHELDLDDCCDAWPDYRTTDLAIRKLFGHGELAEKAIEETQAKHVSRAQLRRQLEQLRASWPQLSLRLRQQLIPFSELKQMLRLAGAPTEPEEIGLTRARLRESFILAYHIRRRFTVLDLAVRTNLLESALGFLFGAAGVWPLDKAAAERKLT